MTDPPLLSIPKSKGLGAGEEEDAPAVKGPVGIGHGKILPEQTEGVVAMMVQVLEPAFRGAGVVLARPSPPSFQLQVAGDPQEELVRGHGSPAEEVARHPVVLSLDLEGIGGRAVAENVGEKLAAGVEPGMNPAEELAVVANVLEHLDRDHPVESVFRLEGIGVLGDDLEVFQSPLTGLPEYEVALGVGVGNGGNSGIRIVPSHPE